MNIVKRLKAPKRRYSAKEIYAIRRYYARKRADVWGFPRVGIWDYPRAKAAPPPSAKAAPPPSAPPPAPLTRIARAELVKRYQDAWGRLSPAAKERAEALLRAKGGWIELVRDVSAVAEMRALLRGAAR